jgi:1-acyl-sn-glycerol-3-phosphate acyltransferase
VTAKPPEIREEVFGADLTGDMLAAARGGPFRPLFRAMVLSVWTAGCLSLLFVGRLVLFPFRHLKRGWRAWVVTRWARGTATVVGMRVEVIGSPPKPPFFLVANHLSYVDILALFTQLGCVFVSKQEVAHWPVVGFLTRQVDTIFVNRESRRDAVRVLDAIDQALNAGNGVVLFPEGTSSAGDRVYPMKAALFQGAVRQGFPVHCAAVHYETLAGDPPAYQMVAWWGSASFASHAVRLCGLRGFRAVIRFAPEPLVGTDRGVLAEQARELVAQHFRPMVDSEEIRQ